MYRRFIIDGRLAAQKSGWVNSHPALKVLISCWDTYRGKVLILELT